MILLLAVLSHFKLVYRIDSVEAFFILPVFLFGLRKEMYVSCQGRQRSCWNPFGISCRVVENFVRPAAMSMAFKLPSGVTTKRYHRQQ